MFAIADGRSVIQLGAVLALAVSLIGCRTALTQSAPHPDRPEIASGRLETDRVRSGCPIRLRFSFRDVEAALVRALASWVYEGSVGVSNKAMRIVQDGFAAVPLDPSALTGRRQGEAEIVLTPLAAQPGQYRYSVQVEDAGGHRSNVLEQSFTVLPQPVGQPVPASRARTMTLGSLPLLHRLVSESQASRSRSRRPETAAPGGVGHRRTPGYAVTTEDVADLVPIKQKLGVPTSPPEAAIPRRSTATSSRATCPPISVTTC